VKMKNMPGKNLSAWLIREIFCSFRAFMIDTPIQGGSKEGGLCPEKQALSKINVI
jgi:hypothetical protein